MEEKNEKDNGETICADDIIERLELMNRELDSINVETDDLDKNKLEYSNNINQYSQNSIDSNKIQNQLKICSKAYIISSFNDQQQTILLRHFLMDASKEDIETIVKELLGTFRYIIKDKNGNYFCTDFFNGCK